MNLVLLEQLVRRLSGGGAAGTALQFVSLTDSQFGAGTGGDDVAKIQAAIDYAEDNDIPHVLCPRPSAGEYTIDCQSIAVNPGPGLGLITVPSGITLVGFGEGVSTFNIINTTTADSANGVNVFQMETGTTNVRFLGLHFRGQNDPFVKVWNNQNSCIYGYGTTSTNTSVEACVFTSLYGFAVHSESQTHVIGCRAVNVANSLANVNGDRIKIHDNYVEGGEFAECSGQAVSIVRNNCYNLWGVGISLGGNQSPGSSYPASEVCDNIIDGVSLGIGITVTDGADAARIQNNTIRRCDYGGINVSALLNEPQRLLISGNTLESNCVSPGVNVVGIDISCGDGHMIFDNTCLDLGVSGYNQKYALVLTSTDSTVVFGNRLSGTLKDASYSASATNIYESGNVHVGQSEEWLVAKAPARSSFDESAVSTGAVELFSIWNSVRNNDAYAMFARYPNGRIEWGPETVATAGVRDTNLYRRDANQLKTDDKFLAAAGIGVGNSASASVAVGSLVKKIEVFDASGNSLGFVPVYSSIT